MNSIYDALGNKKRIGKLSVLEHSEDASPTIES